MKKCPRCRRTTLEDEVALNSLSRRDNKTYICNDCGNDESFIDEGLQKIDDIERDFVRLICDSAESSE